MNLPRGISYRSFGPSRLNRLIAAAQSRAAPTADRRLMRRFGMPDEQPATNEPHQLRPAPSRRWRRRGDDVREYARRTAAKRIDVIIEPPSPFMPPIVISQMMTRSISEIGSAICKPVKTCIAEGSTICAASSARRLTPRLCVDQTTYLPIVLGRRPGRDHDRCYTDENATTAIFDQSNTPNSTG